MTIKPPYHFEKAEHETALEAKHNRPILKSDFLKEWEDLLANCNNESDVQRFIERHPFILPGLWDYHHGPIWDVIVSQFPLGADYVADFAFLTSNSGILQYTFVEIESPKKPIFTQRGSISDKFRKGLQQIQDWYVWAQRNHSLLAEMFSELLEGEQFPFPHSKFYYVCGRRSDVYRTPKHRQRWESFIKTLDKDIEVMTYDRLTDRIKGLPAKVIYDRYVVCAYKDKSFVVKPTSLG